MVVQLAAELTGSLSNLFVGLALHELAAELTGSLSPLFVGLALHELTATLKPVALSRSEPDLMLLNA
jgi:hypothetical protein